MDNFYEILEISESASLQEIRRAYKILVQVWHPDRFQGHQELLKKAEQKTKQINEAFRHLSEPGLRGAHDEYLRSSRLKFPQTKNSSEPPQSRKQETFTTTNCPNSKCNVLLRVPLKGRLKVTCPNPKCRAVFLYDSDLDAKWNVYVQGADDEVTKESLRTSNRGTNKVSLLTKIGI